MDKIIEQTELLLTFIGQPVLEPILPLIHPFLWLQYIWCPNDAAVGYGMYSYKIYSFFFQLYKQSNLVDLQVKAEDNGSLCQ